MKNLLFFSILIVTVICPFYKRRKNFFLNRMKRRRIYEKNIRECLLKSDNFNSDVKIALEEKDKSLFKILNKFKSQLDKNDRIIFRKCRRDYFMKLRERRRAMFRSRFNHSYPYDHFYRKDHYYKNHSHFLTKKSSKSKDDLSDF